MNVSALMTEEVISTKPDESIINLARLMNEKRIHAIPVLDDEGRVLGIITESDFFTKNSSNLSYLPTLIDFLKEGKTREQGMEDDAESVIINAKAKDIMTAPCKTLSQDDNVEDFIQIVKNTGIISVPVTHSATDNRMVGIITVADLMKIM